MSQSVVPSLHTDFLTSLIGCSVNNVKRQIYWNDWNLPDFEQEGDGITELSFDNGDRLTIEHDTSLNVLIKPGAMPIYGDGKFFIFREVTGNDFWQARISQKIVRFVILHYDSPVAIMKYEGRKFRQKTEATRRSEFGLQIDFENQTSVVFLDAMAVDSEETDALVIAAEYDAENEVDASIEMSSEHNSFYYERIIIQ